MIFFFDDSRNKTESRNKSENFKTIGMIESVLCLGAMWISVKLMFLTCLE